MYDALDTERLKRGVTWTHLARQIELPGSSLTRLQSGGRVTIDLAARVAALLRRPMATFTYHAPR
jgi:plasmid maintenance system antidote protein VapI